MLISFQCSSFAELLYHVDLKKFKSTTNYEPPLNTKIRNQAQCMAVFNLEKDNPSGIFTV